MNNTKLSFSPMPASHPYPASLSDISGEETESEGIIPEGSGEAGEEDHPEGSEGPEGTEGELKS